MRFISTPTDRYVVRAVTGINTISFAIAHGDADTSGLLGFAVERYDHTENERYYMFGFKVFRSLYRRTRSSMRSSRTGSRSAPGVLGGT